MATDRMFGSWGEIVFTARITPTVGTFNKSNSWKYAQNPTLSGRNTLQPIGRDLQTIRFSMSMNNFILMKADLTLANRLVGLTGVPDFGQVKRSEDFTLYDDAETILNELFNQADTQQPHAFFEGEVNRGLFVLQSYSESKRHYSNGETKTASVDLNFLEWVEETI